MSNELMAVASNTQEILEPEIVSDDKVFVAGRNWSSMDVRRSIVVEGRTIKEILRDALRREFDKTPTEFQEIFGCLVVVVKSTVSRFLEKNGILISLKRVSLSNS